MHKIPFTEIPLIPLVVRDFLAGKLPEFSSEIFSLENFQVKIQQKSVSYSDEKRMVLVDEISAQYSGISMTEIQEQNLQNLALPNAFTITTGHQLNLFSGPVFFVYKILQTIKTAEFLKQKFPENHFVPIFWMATEDHDFAEINHFHTEENFYSFDEKSGGAVGRITITDADFAKKFIAEIKDFPFGKDLENLVKECYEIGETLMAATRKFVQKLFADFGLLTIDGDSRNLKKEISKTFSGELQNSDLQKFTKEKVEFLKAKYGKVQVNPREINLFFLDENRERIDRDSEGFILNDSARKFGTEEILEILEENPENFSPNALMRPVFQETVLPNICYIGGNAEVAYWLEIKDYFEHLQLPFPVLVPRNSLLFLPEKVLNKIEKSGIPIGKFLENSATSAINFKLKNDSGLFEVLAQKKSEASQIFEAIESRASETDRTFANLVSAEKARQLKSYERMEKRLLKAEKIKNQELAERLQGLFAEINPGGKWQERTYNFSVFYKNGGRDWLRFCYDNINVENSELLILPFLF